MDDKDRELAERAAKLAREVDALRTKKPPVGEPGGDAKQEPKTAAGDNPIDQKPTDPPGS